MDRKVEICEVSISPKAVKNLKNDKPIDVSTVYNTVFGVGYDITPSNIDSIFSDIDWQSVLAYGILISTTYPSLPYSNFLMLFIKYHCSDVCNDGDNIFEAFGNVVANGKLCDLLNTILERLINLDDKELKFIYFKILLDSVALVVSNVLNYSLSDKDIEENIKSKLLFS